MPGLCIRFAAWHRHFQIRGDEETEAERRFRDGGRRMDYTTLNDPKLKVSRLSLGSWAFSGAALWGACDREQAVDTVHMAVDAGINLFDTAEKYGNGEAERVLGEALKGRRDKVLVATKVYSDHLTRDGIRKACEGSLRRLGTDYLDIMQIHWPNEAIPLDETFRAFEDLKKEGKIRAVSVCNHGIICLEHVADRGVVMNQMAYSLVWRVSEKQFSPLMETKNIPVWAYSPLGQGLLTGKFRTVDDVPLARRENRMYNSAWGQSRHTDRGYEKEIFAFLDKLRMICRETGYDMPALAFAFLKSKKIVGSILFGARNCSQLEQNIRSYETEVDPEVVEKIDILSAELRDQMDDNADLWENGLNPMGKPGRIY